MVCYVYNNTSIHSAVGSYAYGGAISLSDSKISIVNGPIKFHNNVADYGGAIYIYKSYSICVDATYLEFYNNNARFYGGAFYIESSVCDNNKIFNSFNMRLIDSHYASSKTARLVGKFVYFNVHDPLHCNASNFIVPYNKRTLFATQPCSVGNLHKAEVFGNYNDKNDVLEFLLHNLHLNHTIANCFNNLCGPASVFIFCDNCNERHEYIVDSSHNNVTMISNDTVVSCPISEGDTIKLVATVNDYNAHSTSVFKLIDVQVSLFNSYENNCSCNDIAHVEVV